MCPGAALAAPVFLCFDGWMVVVRRFTTAARCCHSGPAGSQRESPVVIRILSVHNGETPLSFEDCRFTTGEPRCHSGTAGSQRESPVVIRGLSVHNRRAPLSFGSCRFTTGKRRCHSGTAGSQQGSAVVIRGLAVYNGRAPLSSRDCRFTTGKRRCHPRPAGLQRGSAVVIRTTRIKSKNEIHLGISRLIPYLNIISFIMCISLAYTESLISSTVSSII
ncbi:hypothetical protein BN1048_01264 [Jeotgalicoccus saudimassiliensis]|uniref:Uncharacterized protein n=1 Tax=Jeotgalicoccus saudimassiliensis TaxID=1461582 RepID=A0A078M1F3_9STAP|nr:hypothetical protein BN1048_01264 [Jeotgalicoccus saudimassiliensis]